MPPHKIIMGHKRNVHHKADFKQRLSLKPIQTFDRSDVRMLDMSAESAVAKTVAIPRSIPPHLLMTSILEQICHSYVKDPVKAQQLFKVICEQLSKLKIISPLSFMDEMRSLRVQHRMLFQNLLRKALESINKDEQMLALPSALNVRVERISSISEEVISSQTSRYKSEFEELGRLGKGGYGLVYKARNHLDGRIYAVKKIRFRKKNMESLLRLLREVKALAKLSHTHIVGYNGAWMEYDSPHASGNTYFSLKAQTESDSIIFDFDEGGDIEKGDPARPVPMSLAMNALKFSTIRITEIGDPVTPNDPERTSDVEATFPMSSAERGDC
ncbi:hypothetical protein C0Q70_19246 [Pomacea canaliculata]|uniref:Eukaryotic translation initiation factor 2-alpha kinase 1 n=1 Tax=Pomacea canaliculata TaxID=400727 RepID=A0A2T7NIS7_POMCA|nr:hypothetical protein C0Q70_19246 [Pomacea canaliculata]